MRNLILIAIVVSFTACEVSMPGVPFEGKFSPPSDWVMTPEAEALITPAADGSRWTEITWKQKQELKGRSFSSPCGFLMSDNSVRICDYIQAEDKEDVYRHEVYHAELASLGLEDDNNHSAPHWVLTKGFLEREPAFVRGANNRRVANPNFGQQ